MNTSDSGTRARERDVGVVPPARAEPSGHLCTRCQQRVALAELQVSGDQFGKGFWCRACREKGSGMSESRAREKAGAKDPGAPAGYLCTGCWVRFPISELMVVDEKLGKGFRCSACRADFLEEDFWRE